MLVMATSVVRLSKSSLEMPLEGVESDLGEGDCWASSHASGTSYPPRFINFMYCCCSESLASALAAIAKNNQGRRLQRTRSVARSPADALTQIRLHSLQ